MPYRFPGLTLVFIALFGAVATPASAELVPLKGHFETNSAVVYYLSQLHYRRGALDDALSNRVLDRYLDDIDGSRSYFTAADVAGFEKYRYRLDDALRKGDLRPAFEIYNRYQQRLLQRLNYISTLIDKGVDKLDFSSHERLELDRGKASWPRDEVELDRLWRKRLVHEVLNLKLAGKEMTEIQKLLAVRYRGRLGHAAKLTSEDAFQTYINAFAQTFDPHSEYFSPSGSDNFNINLSLSLEGIGAVLQSEDEFTRVVRLVPGGPAESSRLLQPTDRIVGVGQGGDGGIVDVIGWRLDDVVQLIRGPKNSTVRLEIIRGDGATQHQTRVIAIRRDTVRLEEQAARKQVFEVDRNGHHYKVGVITVPTFYLDFKAMQEGKPDYRSTTRDVKRLLGELDRERIDALVVDLRNNSGGSLQEACALLGLFIDDGPTVQIRHNTGKVEILGDPEPGIAYNGPLAVMVNRISASASEIFAAAVQDYNRGVVIGSRSFGKGTVQSLYPLDHGQIKLTQGKFYRVTGASTQHQGVIPDVVYPSVYDHELVGESVLDNALEWDTIRGIDFRQHQPGGNGLHRRLQELHEARVAANPDFRYLRERLVLAQELQRNKSVSLNEAERRRESTEIDRRRLELENRRRVAKNEAPVKSLAELPSGDNLDETREKEVDALLRESGEILVDLVTLTPRVAGRNGVGS